MKQTFTYAALLLAGFLLVSSCKNKQKQAGDTAKTDSSAVVASPATEAAPLSERLEKLLGGGDALFRGINLGDPVATVKQTEKAEQFESDGKHVGYTIEYSNLESADIQYFQDGAGKVNKIEADLYLNNRASVDQLLKELSAYFSQRYGTAKQSGTQTIWTATNTAQITLADVSKGKDFGLKLTFLPSGETVTAKK